jgi:hypothetical protein
MSDIEYILFQNEFKIKFIFQKTIDSIMDIPVAQILHRQSVLNGLRDY